MKQTGLLREDAAEIGVDYMEALPEDAQWNLSPVECYNRALDEIDDLKEALAKRDAYAEETAGLLRQALQYISESAHVLRSKIEATLAKGNLNFDGNGRVSVDVNNLVASPQFKRQVEAVREISKAEEDAMSERDNPGLFKREALTASFDAEALARRFHEAYERLAPQFGYETRPDTKVFQPFSKNGLLMVAVCREIIGSCEEHPQRPALKWCDNCDGVGWAEGTPKLGQACEVCNGTGTVPNDVRGGAPSDATNSPGRQEP